MTGTGGMTLGGWIFLILGWGSMIGLLVFTFYLVLCRGRGNGRGGGGEEASPPGGS